MINLISGATSGAVCYLGSHFLARTAEQGLAYALGLSTLRHETNPLFWLSIHTVGFLPSMGGSEIGGDAIMRKDATTQNENNVFFAIDIDDFTDRESRNNLTITKKLEMRLVPRSFCYTSCLSLVNKTKLLPVLKHAERSSSTVETVAKISTMIVSLFIPTIKVRIDPETLKTLKNDAIEISAEIKNEYDKLKETGINEEAIKLKLKEKKEEIKKRKHESTKLKIDVDMPKESIYTSEWVSPLNIGLAGTLWNGLSYKVINRIKDNPNRAITGLAFIALSTSVAYASYAVFPEFISTHKTAIIAGITLAII